MNKQKAKFMFLKNHLNNILFYGVISSLSIIITFIMLSYNQPFNPDGLRYLKTALICSNQGLKEAIILYPWPFYSILIAITAKISHLSLLNSAHLVDMILDTITIIFFIMLTKELGGSRKTQIIALFVILFFPYLNHLRDDIMRDHGYYSLSLIAIWCLIRYNKTECLKYALFFGFSIIFATLFRIEGFFFAILTPIVLLLKNKKYLYQRLFYTLKAYSVHIGLFLILLIYTISTKHHEFGRLIEIKKQLFTGLQHTYDILQSKKLLLTQYILPFHLLRYSKSFMWGGLFGLYIYNFLYTIGIPYLILASYAIFKKLIKDKYANIILFAFISINILITILFTIQNFFLARRYLILLSLLLLLFAPFSIESIYSDLKMKGKTITRTITSWTFSILIIFLLYTAISSIYYFGPSKTYVIETGNWIKNNIPKNSKILFNNPMLEYYANGTYKYNEHYDKILDKQNVSTYDYVVLKINRKETILDEQFKNLNIQPIKTFKNKKGDKATIFTVKQNEINT